MKSIEDNVMKKNITHEKKIKKPARCVELFSGAGGLALGISKAGFEHEAVIEWNKDACETIRLNQKNQLHPVVDWPLFECDARDFDYSPYEGRVDMVSGGPPCQPFSLGGKHKGPCDARDMFPEAVRAIRELRPKAFIFENVKGLLRESFSKYFEYILLQLTHPDLRRKTDMSWEDHLSKLERHHTGTKDQPSYKVVFSQVNAADFGVPQKRQRVIIVGFRSDLGLEWSFPKPTHSQEALLWSQWVTGDYWEKHKVAKKNRPEFSNRSGSKINSLKASLFPPETSPWLTVRDALAGLPDPQKEHNIPNHVFISGARSYPGHSGSPLDEPAKTLKAGDHGVPGGENTLLLPNGDVRYFTVRESARLQNFPDEFLFQGSWGECMRQIGNAVPVKLASIVSGSVGSRLGF